MRRYLSDEIDDEPILPDNSIFDEDFLPSDHDALLAVGDIWKRNF
jgi:hypothetical protein